MENESANKYIDLCSGTNNLRLGMFYARYSFVCDYASSDRNGKLNANGIFNVIHVPKVPIDAPQFYYVCVLDGLDSDVGTHALQIEFQSPDGKQEPTPLISCNVPKNKVGSGCSIQLMTKINSRTFESYGRHEIVLFVDGVFGSRTFIDVVQSVKTQPK